MDVKQIFKLWTSDKSNVSLTIDLLAECGKSKNEALLEQLSADISKIYSDNPSILVKLVEAFIHVGNYDRALIVASTLARLTSSHPMAIHYLILTNFLLSNNQQVIDLYCEHKIMAESELFVARAYYLLGEIDTAIDILAKNINGDSSAERKGILAIAYFDKGDVKRAKNYSEKALAEDSTQFESLLASASVYSVYHQFEQALPYIEQCLIQQPNNGRALSLLGQTYLYALNFELAINTLIRATQYMPAHIGTWHLLGWCYWITQNQVEAKKAFTTALNLNPNFSESHGALACVAVSENDFEQAKTLARKAVKLDKNCFSGRFANSLILAAQGDELAANQAVEDILSGSADATDIAFVELINKARETHINQ